MRHPLLPLFALLIAAALTFCQQAAAAGGVPEFTELAARCGPAVVNINTEKSAKASGPEEFFGEMFRGMPRGFERFFEPFSRRGRPPVRRQKSLGSGFLISADGYIVTNFHVVDGADVINVTLDEKATKGKTSLKATLVGSDPETDLALLKIESKESLPFLNFGNSDNLKVGEWVLAIGNPFGLDHTVTSGIVSAKGRRINAGAFDNFLQTDASINPGNSGGPLINMQGEVVGINTAILASGQGLGFAIPSSMASEIISQVRTGKKISRGWLGIVIQDVDEPTAQALGLPDHKGALVASVQPGQPAALAGMQDGDIIRKIDGEEVADRDSLLRLVAAKKPGSSAKVEIFRAGETKTLTVKLGDRQSSLEGAGGPAGPEGGDRPDANLGLTVRPVTPDEARSLGVDAGLMVLAVDESKPAAAADLRPGDIIVKANMKPVRTTAELGAIVKNEGLKRGAIVLQINRRGDLVFRTIELTKK